MQVAVKGVAVDADGIVGMVDIYVERAVRHVRPTVTQASSAMAVVEVIRWDGAIHVSSSDVTAIPSSATSWCRGLDRPSTPVTHVATERRSSRGHRTIRHGILISTVRRCPSGYISHSWYGIHSDVLVGYADTACAIQAHSFPVSLISTLRTVTIRGFAPCR